MRDAGSYIGVIINPKNIFFYHLRKSHNFFKMEFSKVKSKKLNIEKKPFIKELLRFAEYESYGSNIFSNNRPSEDSIPFVLEDKFTLYVPHKLYALGTWEKGDIKRFLQSVVNTFSIPLDTEIDTPNNIANFHKQILEAKSYPDKKQFSLLSNKYKKIIDGQTHINESLFDMLLQIHNVLLEAEIEYLNYKLEVFDESENLNNTKSIRWFEHDDEPSYSASLKEENIPHTIETLKQEYNLFIFGVSNSYILNKTERKKANNISTALHNIFSIVNIDLFSKVNSLAKKLVSHSPITLDDTEFETPSNIHELSIFRNISVLNYLCSNKKDTDTLIFFLQGCVYLSVFKRIKLLKGNFKFINDFHHKLTVNVLKLLDKLGYEYIPEELEGIICKTRKKTCDFTKKNDYEIIKENFRGILYLSKLESVCKQYKTENPMTLTNNFMAFTQGFLSARCIRFYEKYNKVNNEANKKEIIKEIRKLDYTEIANKCEYLDGFLCTETHWDCPFIKPNRLWRDPIKRLNSRQIKFLFNYSRTYRDIDRVLKGELKTYPINLFEAIEENGGLPIFLFDNSPRYCLSTPLHAKNRYVTVLSKNGYENMPASLMWWNRKPFYVDDACFKNIKDELDKIDEYELKSKIRNYYKKIDPNHYKDSNATELEFVLGIKDDTYNFCFIKVFLDLCKILEWNPKKMGFIPWIDPALLAEKTWY